MNVEKLAEKYNKPIKEIENIVNLAKNEALFLGIDKEHFIEQIVKMYINEEGEGSGLSVGTVSTSFSPDVRPENLISPYNTKKKKKKVSK